MDPLRIAVVVFIASRERPHAIDLDRIFDAQGMLGIMAEELESLTTITFATC